MNLGWFGFVSKQFVEVADFFVKRVELSRQTLNVRGCAAINVEVEFAAQAVFGVLPILAHHNNRSLNGREHGKEQIEQDERIRVPGGSAHRYANDAVGNKSR